MFNNSPPGAAVIEWYHSPSVSPVSPNIRPMFDVVEDPIIRTPDRSLRELKYTFHEKCSNKKTNILFDGIGFRYSRGRKSLTWRCTLRPKKVACLAKVISLFKIKHLRICFRVIPRQNIQSSLRHLTDFNNFWWVGSLYLENKVPQRILLKYVLFG
jgi:hypothetical protein